MLYFIRTNLPVRIFFVLREMSILICDRLKIARKECKFTQQQVADLLGVDRSTYAYYELGVSNPSIENLIVLSNIFNADIRWLMGADKDAESFSSPENELSLIKAVKERHLTELSKDERQLVALYRLAGVYGKKEELIAILKQVTVADDEE